MQSEEEARPGAHPRALLPSAAAQEPCCPLTSAPVWAGPGAGESGESGRKHSPTPTEACGGYGRWEEQVRSVRGSS